MKQDNSSHFHAFNSVIGLPLNEFFSADSDDDLERKAAVVLDFLKRCLVTSGDGKAITPHPSTLTALLCRIRIYVGLRNPLLLELLNQLDMKKKDGFKIKMLPYG